MARYLALEWDETEARVAVARTRGSDISVEHAFDIDLGEGAESDPAHVGKTIAAALESRGLTKTETIVGVGRASTELRLLQMPAAPPEEMPEMVRFQAMRQFAAIGEQWPLDFTEVSASESGDDSISVLAAAVSPDLISQIRTTCEPSQLLPQRIVLRPFAAASLLRRRGGIADGCQLVIDCLADEADLTVLADGEVAFMRTVRIPNTGSAETTARAILGEIRRTIAAARNQLGGRSVEHVTVFGSGEEHAALKSQAEKTLSLEVTLFDPFDQVHLSGELAGSLPDNHGRFAPLLGMLADELTGVRHAIDFLNPRRRPKPPSKRKQHSLIGIGAGVLVAAIVFLVVVLFIQKNSEINDLTNRRNELKKMTDKKSAWKTQREEVDKFLKSDINWIDEIYRIAEMIPNRDDVMVDSVTLQREVAKGGGGVIHLQMHVKDNEFIPRLAKSLTDKNHVVTDYGQSTDPKRPDHPWILTQKIEVKRNRLHEMADLKNQPATSPTDSKTNPKTAAVDSKPKK